MFYDLMESDEINVEDCNMMMKACHSAAQMRELIDATMAKAKLKPNVVTYNTLVGTLRMEGDDAVAESVVEEMKTWVMACGPGTLASQCGPMVTGRLVTKLVLCSTSKQQNVGTGMGTTQPRRCTRQVHSTDAVWPKK